MSDAVFRGDRELLLFSETTLLLDCYPTSGGRGGKGGGGGGGGGEENQK